MSEISANLSPQERAERLENARFVGFLAPKIIAIELRLRDQVSALRPDAYAAECAECGAPTLGDLSRIILAERLNKQIFRRDQFKFKRYHPQNNDGYDAVGGVYGRFLPHIRVRVMLNLYRSVRNRAFHCADMFELVRNQRGELVPRVFTQEHFGAQTLSFTVAPERIARLLDDIAAAIGVADWEEY